VNYVALGSSFAAGPGIRPLADRGAMRSSKNYARLLSGLRGLRLIDVTCSAARTEHLLDTPQRTLTGTRPPQLDAVTPETDLVTVTVGGNDLGYVTGMMAASLRNALPLLHGSVQTPDDGEFRTLTRALVHVVDGVRSRAPRARVLIVDYLALIGPDTAAGSVGLAPADLVALNETARRFTEAQRAAAAGTGAEFVDIAALSAGHALGSAQPWVGGRATGVPWLGGPIAFHPNAAGMRAVADALAQHLA